MWTETEACILVILMLSSPGLQSRYNTNARNARQNYDEIPSNLQCQMESGELGMCHSSAYCLRERVVAVLAGVQRVSSKLAHCSYRRADGGIFQGACCVGAFQSPYVVTVHLPSHPLGSSTSVISSDPAANAAESNGTPTVIQTASAIAGSHGVSSSAGSHFFYPQLRPISGSVATPTEPQADAPFSNGSVNVPVGPWIEGVNWPPQVPTHPPDHQAPTHPPHFTIPPAPTHPPGLFPAHPAPPLFTPRPPSQPTTPAPPTQDLPIPGLPPGIVLPPGISQWPPPLPTHPPIITTTSPIIGFPGGIVTPPRPSPGPPPGPAPGPQPGPQPGEYSCGLKKEIGLGFKVVGGKEAGKHEWRWMAALFTQSRGRLRLFCGGSLIDAYHVLTAAHCLRGMPASALTIQLGDHDVSITTEARHVTVKAASIRIHPAYNDHTNQNDLAIIRLASKVTFTENIIPICLPSPEEVSDFTGEVATVSGWGSLAYGQTTSNILYSVELSIWKHTDCDQAFTRFFTTPGHIATSMICAGQLGKDSCTGDSGGPLMIEKNGRWIQIGIVSWGIQCGSQPLPGVYTRVTSFRNWVDLNRT